MSVPSASPSPVPTDLNNVCLTGSPESIDPIAETKGPMIGILNPFAPLNIFLNNPLFCAIAFASFLPKSFCKNLFGLPCNLVDCPLGFDTLPLNLFFAA